MLIIDSLPVFFKIKKPEDQQIEECIKSVSCEQVCTNCKCKLRDIEDCIVSEKLTITVEENNNEDSKKLDEDFEEDNENSEEIIDTENKEEENLKEIEYINEKEIESITTNEVGTS